MNKKFLFSLLSLFAISVVTAAYLVNSFVITTDVYEPFEVQYAILGDAGNYDGSTLCSEYSGAWISGEEDIDVDGLYAGESRKFCAKITNLGEGEVDYTLSGEVESGNGNLAKCENAFGNPSVSGSADASGDTYDGMVVNVADDADPINDCRITVSLSRG